MKTRRDFLKNTTLAGLGMLSLPELAKAVVNEQNGVSAPKITIKNNAVILFQGDSITDCGRNREAVDCNTFDMIGPRLSAVGGDTTAQDVCRQASQNIQSRHQRK